MPEGRDRKRSRNRAPELILLKVEKNQVWDEMERATIQQVALDVGKAIARDIHLVTERSRRLGGLLSEAGVDSPSIPLIDPADAFRMVYGRPVTFLRKAKPAGGQWWGETVSRDKVNICRNAPHSSTNDATATVGTRPQFSVHELGHVFENVIQAAIGKKRGREDMPPSLVNRPNGFLPGRWQQSPKVERGEIFADMFVGWVYDRWETIDGSPDSPLREMGLDRKNFMDGIMIELIEIAMAHNKNR